MPHLQALVESRTSWIYRKPQPRPRHPLFTDSDFAGVGLITAELVRLRLFPLGFVRYFDPALLLCESQSSGAFAAVLVRFQTRTPRLICGLGHGVLPGTPEDLRLFVDTVREVSS